MAVQVLQRLAAFGRVEYLTVLVAQRVLDADHPTLPDVHLISIAPDRRNLDDWGGGLGKFRRIAAASCDAHRRGDWASQLQTNPACTSWPSRSCGSHTRAGAWSPSPAPTPSATSAPRTAC